MLAQLRLMAWDQTGSYVCVLLENICVSVYLWQCVGAHVPLTVAMAGLVAAVVQRVLTPVAGPSMPSSPTTPTGADFWSSAITDSMCVRGGGGQSEKTTRGSDSHPSCQLFYSESDWGLPGRQG